MRNARIKIYGIARFQEAVLRIHAKTQGTGDHINKFHTGVLVQADLIGTDTTKLGVVGIQFPFHGSEIQALKKIGRLGIVGLSRKPQSFFVSRNGQHAALAVIGEEKFELGGDQEGRSLSTSKRRGR
jgi:hypothetical protein